MGARCLDLTRSGGDSGSFLESAINGFESLQGIEQLQASFADLLGAWSELLRMFDGEFDSVDRNARLVSHLEFNR